MNRILFFFLIALLACKSTNKVDQTPTELRGKLVNLTGLDGCTWVIQLDNKLPDGIDKLEPANLDEFNLDLVEGAKVAVSYEELGGASVCMVGKVVRIKSIRTVK